MELLISFADPPTLGRELKSIMEDLDPQVHGLKLQIHASRIDIGNLDGYCRMIGILVKVRTETYTLMH